MIESGDNPFSAIHATPPLNPPLNACLSCRQGRLADPSKNCVSDSAATQHIEAPISANNVHLDNQSKFCCQAYLFCAGIAISGQFEYYYDIFKKQVVHVVVCEVSWQEVEHFDPTLTTPLQCYK
jgi:hypothetical protein